MAAILQATPRDLVNDAAVRNGLRPEFVRSVAAVESNFQPNAVSPKGALGLMQLMPGTAASLGANPKDPAQNADAGARYLRQLLLRYKNSPDQVRLALAAYNAGPGAVDRFKNIPPYRETEAYVEKVLKNYLDQLKP
jgi:soluble lytic murein transglycosylase-like protein